MLVMFAAGRRLYLTILAYWQIWWTRYKTSEWALFRQLTQACHANDPRATYHALLGWIDKREPELNPASLSALQARYPDEELQKQLQILQDAVLTRSTTWVGRPLSDTLSQVRKNIMKLCRSANWEGLPPLNPS